MFKVKSEVYSQMTLVKSCQTTSDAIWVIQFCSHLLMIDIHLRSWDVCVDINLCKKHGRCQICIRYHITWLANVVSNNMGILMFNVELFKILCVFVGVICPWTIINLQFSQLAISIHPPSWHSNCPPKVSHSPWKMVLGSWKTTFLLGPDNFSGANCSTSGGRVPPQNPPKHRFLSENCAMSTWHHGRSTSTTATSRPSASNGRWHSWQSWGR